MTATDDPAARMRAALGTVRTGTWPLPVEAVLAVLEELEQLRAKHASLQLQYDDLATEAHELRYGPTMSADQWESEVAS